MDQDPKRKQSFLLRLPVSVREQATHIAHEDGTSLNHFIGIAVAEKLSRRSWPVEQKVEVQKPLEMHIAYEPAVRM